MNKHYHLIGIGGIGMSGIAKLLLRRGMTVSGSDMKASRITEELIKSGARVYLGHAGANIANADLVVYSSAIKGDNPEFREAKKQGLPLIKRAEALAYLMKDKTVITVSGSHGKTTTTSLASYLLLEAGFLPTAAIGGIFKNIDTNACMGDGEFFVAEADESDGSFLYYRPKYSIITNIDREHLDYYKDFANEVNAFSEFIDRTVEGGCVFACSDDTALKNILKGYKNKHVFFGLNGGADICPDKISMDGLASEFDCRYKGKFIDRFKLSLGGVHNISNALSVIALGLELGINLKVIKTTLAGYQGAARRLEVRLNNAGYIVIDDYAHHPTEIKATLAAVKNLKANRIIAVFQPHRYTRTQLLLDEFCGCFDLADHVIITDIYPAGEAPLDGVTGMSVHNKISQRSPHKPVYFVGKEGIAGHVLEFIKPGDLVVTLGAGDITRVCDELVERIKRKG